MYEKNPRPTRHPLLVMGVLRSFAILRLLPHENENELKQIDFRINILILVPISQLKTGKDWLGFDYIHVGDDDFEFPLKSAHDSDFNSKTNLKDQFIRQFRSSGAMFVNSGFLYWKLKSF